MSDFARPEESGRKRPAELCSAGNILLPENSENTEHAPGTLHNISHTETETNVCSLV